MAKKKALQKLKRGPDGRQKLVYVDAETGSTISDKEIENYEIVSADGGGYWSGLGKSAATPTETEQESVASEPNYKYSDRDKDYTASKSIGGSRKAADNYGYKKQPKLLKAAKLVPGVIGKAAAAAGVALNANNIAAVNEARRVIGLPSLSKGEMLKSVVKDQKGQVADVRINKNDYSVGFEALSPKGNTNLTPEEARRRGMALGGVEEIGKRKKSTPEVETDDKSKTKKSGGFLTKMTGLEEGWLGDGIKDLFKDDEVSTPKKQVEVTKPIQLAPAQVANRPHSEAVGFIGKPNQPGVSYEFGEKTKRNQIPSSGIGEKIGGIASKLGLQAHMYSGQEPEDQKPVGSAYRHPEGYAGDFYFTDQKGEVVKDPKVLEQIALETAAIGGNAGMGPEYMGNANMHLDTMPIEQYPGHGQAWGSTARGWSKDMAWAKDVGQNPRPASAPIPTSRPDPLSLDPVGNSLNVEGSTFDSIGPKDNYAQQVVADRISTPSSSVIDASPAKLASMGFVARTPDQIGRMAFALAGEMSPDQLKALEANDPIAKKELANMVTTIENRAASKTWGSFDNVFDPDQYNSMMTGKLDTTKGNYGIYKSVLEDQLGGYYKGMMEPDNYGLTNYYNPASADPSWGPKMDNKAKTGDHLFGTLGPAQGDYKYEVSDTFKNDRDRLSMQLGTSDRDAKGTFGTTSSPGYGRSSLGVSSSDPKMSKPSGSNYKESSSSSRSSNPSHSVERGRDTSLGSGNKTQKESKPSSSPKESKTKETKSTGGEKASTRSGGAW